MDIDLDLPTTFKPEDYFDVVRASRVEKGELKPHPCGAYLQNIARDPQTNLAAIPFREAEQYGYFKVDFLHLTLLDYFESKEQIRVLSKTDPDWSLLEYKEHVEKLFQIHRHFAVVNRIKPQSIQQLADCIALIRPAKRHLLEAYIKDKQLIRPEIYTKPDDQQYYFKKSHAVAYATTIVLQLHLIKGGIL